MIQSLVTVVLPFPKKAERRVNLVLERLGDRDGPAYQSLDARLRGSDGRPFVHFMSIVVVPSRMDYEPASAPDAIEPPAHLVIELSADGEARDAIVNLVRSIPDVLRRVLREISVNVPDEELADCLWARTYVPSPSIWQKYRHGAPNGVVFSGTPDLSVARILEERDLATRIRRLLEGRPHGAAFERLTHVRKKIFADVDYKWAFVPEPMSKIVGPALREDRKEPTFFEAAGLAMRYFLWPLLAIPVFFFLRCLLQDVPLGPWWAWFLLVCDVDVQTWAWWEIVARDLMRALWLSAKTLPSQLLEAILHLIAVLTVLIAGVGVLGWYLYKDLLRREREDVPVDLEPSRERMAEIQRFEDPPGFAHNHLAGVSVIKKGLVRHFTLRLALAIINYAALVSKPGFIDKIGSIHFARWIRLPETDKLVFLSNYGGSWQSYLEDFIARLRAGLTSVWSNTLNFPETANLFQKGAGDGARFKRWARRQQVPTRFWYSAYPDLTTDRIRTNALIRNGFARAATEQEAADWLSHFGYVGRATLDMRQIPTLAFGGLSRLPFAHCFLVRITSSHAARQFLKRNQLNITYGDRMPAYSALVVGFTARGLQMLGLTDEAIATFPMAFQQGMSYRDRARALGDDPGRWTWRDTGAGAIDAVVLIYDASPFFFNDRVRKMRDELQPVGVTDEIGTAALPEVIEEPFGFRDGISQPIMRGTLRASRDPASPHVVDPGELVLGYADNLGIVAPTPHECGFDMGRNGTFLVIRQLDQDTIGFDQCVNGIANALQNDVRVPTRDLDRLREWIAAKMVGRWKDGTSLVRNPNERGTLRHPEASPDNTFMYGREDPDGLGCPFGAHIRRANPRDSFEPNSRKQVDISNRHRILRVGRAYGADGMPRGLLFMCVNADIERQFEFLQQTWLLGPNFHGLEGEVDPIVGCAGDHCAQKTMVVPTPNGPLRLPPLANFVSVRGGAYFFLPSKNALQRLARGSVEERAAHNSVLRRLRSQRPVPALQPDAALENVGG